MVEISPTIVVPLSGVEKVKLGHRVFAQDWAEGEWEGVMLGLESVDPVDHKEDIGRCLPEFSGSRGSRGEASPRRVVKVKAVTTFLWVSGQMVRSS